MEEFVGKEVKVIYDDSNPYPTKKVGVLIKVSGSLFHIEKEDGSIEILNQSRIVRVEVNEDKV